MGFRIKDGLLKKYIRKPGETDVVILDSVTTIGKRAFYSCDGLMNIVIPAGVTTISEEAFKDCRSLTSVVIPDSVTTIGGGAFQGCGSLTSVVIPDSVTTIGGGAFWGCSSLTSIVIPDSVITIGGGAFQGCSSLTSVVIPDSVTTIGGGTFWGCSSLTSVVIPDSVITIGEGAFQGCSSLTSIVIPNSVTTIGRDAFSDCHNLTSVVIPDSVTTIGERAFWNCSNLMSVAISGSVTTIGYGAFWDCSSNLEVHVSSLEHYMGLRIDGSHKLFVNDILITDITNLDRVTAIGENAFSSCDSLRSIIIPDSVTAIGEEAFHCCHNLTNIVIPDSVTTIGGDAFSGCHNLMSIVIPDSVTTIGNEAFSYCASLTSIIIPGSVKVIKGNILLGCNAVQNIQISPSTLAGCKDLSFWIYIISRLSLHDLIAAIKKCPSLLVQKAERIILESDDIEAVRYFEKQNCLEEYAAFHNTDADTLRDSVLSDFGLDEQGCRSWPLAGSFITARMEKNLSITLLDANGKVLRSVPKKGADPTEYDTAKKELAQLKKDIASAAKLRNNRLLADFLEARPRSAKSWKATYLKNPLLKALAKLVVWQQGEMTFILDENGTPIDAAGKEVPLGDEEILLAHPMEMGSELTKAWQDYFLNHHLSQPFAQVWEPVLDGSTITPDRYAGATIPQYMLMNKGLHGITMEGQSRLKLRDCTADLALVREHHDWVNNEYEITNFRFEKFTRAVNHIAAHFDKGTVLGRLLKDDASAVQWLDYFTLAQITDFIARVTEKGDCPNSTAALLEYKQTKYPDTDPFADFVLEW